jgi:hypothetical protein
MNALVAQANRAYQVRPVAASVIDVEFETIVSAAPMTTKEKGDLIIAFGLAMVLGLVGAAVSIGSFDYILHKFGL